MKVSELTGEWLDYWVARAEGHEVDQPLAPGQEWPDREKLGRKYEPNYIRFSTEWAFGGPIIEREEIALVFFIEWDAHVRGGYDRDEGVYGDAKASGSTPLIAAMRAFVASKFGEEVPEA